MYVDGSKFKSLRELANVHIMGVLNLVYNVVKKLKSKGVRCVASTTERKVEEKVSSNGEIQKIATFKFCKFREY